MQMNGFCDVWRNRRREEESAVAGIDICCSFVYALARWSCCTCGAPTGKGKVLRGRD